MQLKVTLTDGVARALAAEAATQDRSLSYVVAKVLIDHYATGERPPRAGRPIIIIKIKPDDPASSRATDLTNPDHTAASKSVASATADKYFPKAKRAAKR